MARPRPTIGDVARRAEVSVGTVSNVLSGSAKVSADRRERVLRAIADLRYAPNVHAQGLRRRRSNVVGVCFPHGSTAYLTTLSQTVEDIASRHGYGVIHVFSRHDPVIELRHAGDLLKYGADGLLLLPSPEPEQTLDLAHHNGLPLVIVDRPTDDARFDHVIVDNRKAIREAATRLIALGHDRLLFVCRWRSRLVTRHRLDGLADARRAAAAPVIVDCIAFENDDDALSRGLAAAMRSPSPPTALIASNSHQASLVLGTLRALGVRCPGEVSVMAFDDPEWSHLVEPALSVIRQPAATIAETAWKLLMRRIRTRRATVQRVFLDATIEFRGSVGVPVPRPRDAGLAA
jgi:LacI family transcriptional regulator